jgi:hypothetical protein
VVDEELVRRPDGDIHVLAADRLADGAIAEVVLLRCRPAGRGDTSMTRRIDSTLANVPPID